MNHPPPALQLQDVRLTLSSLAGPVDILAGVSLTVPAGQTVAMTGPSGSGKSSLLMVAAGLEKPSAGGLARLDWSLADKPDAAIIELGSNDMLRGLPPAQTEKNLRAILTRLKAAKVKVLLTGMKAQRNLGADYVKSFDGIYPRLAKEFGVLFYPFMLDGVALQPKLNQADRIHPNPQGVKVMVARMLPLVKKLASQTGKAR